MDGGTQRLLFAWVFMNKETKMNRKRRSCLFVHSVGRTGALFMNIQCSVHVLFTKART